MNVIVYQAFSDQRKPVCGGKEICEAGTELLLRCFALHVVAGAANKQDRLDPTSEKRGGEVEKCFPLLFLGSWAGGGGGGWWLVRRSYVLAEHPRNFQNSATAPFAFPKASLSAWTGPSRYFV
jgi:hypothetical protein